MNLPPQAPRKQHKLRPHTEKEAKDRNTTHGLCRPEEAKETARKMFELYDKNHDGVLDQKEVEAMLVDFYKLFNRILYPSETDIEYFHDSLDRDGDGVVKLSDIEELCSHYLTSNFIDPSQQRESATRSSANRSSALKQ